MFGYPVLHHTVKTSGGFQSGFAFSITNGKKGFRVNIYSRWGTFSILEPKPLSPKPLHPKPQEFCLYEPDALEARTLVPDPTSICGNVAKLSDKAFLIFQTTFAQSGGDADSFVNEISHP